jgi:uncharacterized protein DUF5069
MSAAMPFRRLQTLRRARHCASSRKASAAWLVEEPRRMDALDLSQRPPRSPRELLPGLDLLMAARTVDKIRATLPGGNLGEYQITGFSSRLIEKLGFPEAALRAVVAKAASDREVGDWIARHSDPARYAEINAALERPTVGERFDDAAFMARYPVARTLAPETSRLDLLVADDEAAFH